MHVPWISRVCHHPSHHIYYMHIIYVWDRPLAGDGHVRFHNIICIYVYKWLVYGRRSTSQYISDEYTYIVSVCGYGKNGKARYINSER